MIQDGQDLNDRGRMKNITYLENYGCIEKKGQIGDYEGGQPPHIHDVLDTGCPN